MQTVIKDLSQELADLSPSDRETILRETDIQWEIRAQAEPALDFYDSGTDCSLIDLVESAAENVQDSGATREIRRRGHYDLGRLPGSTPSLWYVSYEFCRQMSIAFLVSFGPRRTYSENKARTQAA